MLPARRHIGLVEPRRCGALMMQFLCVRPLPAHIQPRRAVRPAEFGQPVAFAIGRRHIHQITGIVSPLTRAKTARKSETGAGTVVIKRCVTGDAQ